MGAKDAGLLSALLVARSFDGGAGRAAQRIFRAISEHEDESLSTTALITRQPSSPDSVDMNVQVIKPRLERKLSIELTTRTLRKLGRLGSGRVHSLALVDSGLVTRVNSFDADVVNLHWLGGDTLSIKEISSIRAPIVWTLHDEWFYRGAEHYGDDEFPVEGYSGRGAKGLIDVNQKVWQQKKSRWTRPMHLIAPSNWLADRARRSILGQRNFIHVVPYPIHTDFWRPIPHHEAAESLGLDPSKRYLLTGSLAADRDFRKGRDLILSALEAVEADSRTHRETEVILFGGKIESGMIGRFRYRDLGTLNDPELRAAYSVAEVFLMGSRFDNLPQTAMEAAACGTATIAFKVGGLPDLIVDDETGFLIEPFDVGKMGQRIGTILDRPNFSISMGKRARVKAVQTWAPAVVSAMYQSIFRAAVEDADYRRTD